MQEPSYVHEYNFKRLAQPGEKSWLDVINRFIGELKRRKCKTPVEDLEWLLHNFIALPNSPALLTAGCPKFYASACSSYISCDSLSEGKFSILESLDMGVKATKAGIGTGWNFSLLRSKDEPVKFGVNSQPNAQNKIPFAYLDDENQIQERLINAGGTGGPVSFLRAYDGFMKEITQATRKSASMGLLSVHHPDIMDYINCKRQDGTIAGFNLSVVIDDKFMQAVEADDYYELKYITSDKTKTIKARELFDAIALGAWTDGEPGIMFSDTIINDYFEDLKEEEILANPCVTGETEILTDTGYVRIDSVVGKKVNVWNGFEWSEVEPRITGENQSIFNVKLSNGLTLDCTKTHKWVKSTGYKGSTELVETQNLKKGDKIGKYHYPIIRTGIPYSDMYTQGFISADGDGSKYIKVYKPKQICLSRLNGVQTTGNNQEEFVRIKLNFYPKEKTFVPIDGDLTSRLEWFAGCLDGDGCELKEGGAQIGSISKEFLLRIQKMLSLCGVASKVRKNKEAQRRFLPDQKGGQKEYECQPIFRLLIGAKQIQLLKNLGMQCQRLAFDKYPQRDASQFVIIEDIIEKGIVEKVYCFTEPKKHLGCFNGIVTGQCSEALLTYKNTLEEQWLELCVLASINLPKYISLSKQDRKRAVATIVGMLNDIIDKQDYVLEEQRIGMQDKNRKIGIGVAGLATILAMQKIPYESDEAAELTKQLFAEIGVYAYEASAKLGDLRGIGRYNGSLLSVAPTSTISNVFNDMNEMGCSYGIEPYFSLEPMVIKNSYGEFDKTEKIVKYLNGDITGIKCANDLTYIDHLKPLEAYYTANPKGYCQGASKTLNFKNQVTVEDIKESILYCWKHKIKAISFYRDGSRKNQVINVKSSLNQDERPTEIVFNHAPKRPEILPCDISHVQSQGEKWVVLVSLLGGKVYEVFAGLENKINIPKKFKTGYIMKEKVTKDTNRYSLIIGSVENEDEQFIKDIPSVFDNSEHGAFTRVLSGLLRHGTPIKYVCEMLQKDGGFDALNKAIARVLKKYIDDGEKSGETCRECGAKMQYVQGCLTCSCGYSKCG